MDFTKEQLSEVLCKHAERENGLQDLMEIMIESMMVAERREYLREDGLPGDKGNGFRKGHTFRTFLHQMMRVEIADRGNVQGLSQRFNPIVKNAKRIPIRNRTIRKSDVI